MRKINPGTAGIAITGQDAESYTFYRVPKILFTAEAIDHLSTDAKLLYGILLDRMQLSVKNSWIDEDGKVFIYYGEVSEPETEAAKQ